MWLWQTGRVIQKLGLALCYFVMQVQRWSQAQFSAGSVFFAQPTNMSRCCLLAAQPAAACANSLREIGKFCQVAPLGLVAISAEAPCVPSSGPTSHRLRRQPDQATSATGAHQARQPWPGKVRRAERAGLGSGSTSSCCPGKDLNSLLPSPNTFRVQLSVAQWYHRVTSLF